MSEDIRCSAVRLPLQYNLLFPDFLKLTILKNNSNSAFWIKFIITHNRNNLVMFIPRDKQIFRSNIFENVLYHVCANFVPVVR